jgi:hypothetical protein
MSTSTPPQLAHLLATDLGVTAAYQHYPKHVTPGDVLATRAALLKWYGIHRSDAPIPDEITALARETLTTSLTAGGLGWVILHRCGADFYFLIACTWRENNEVWETVYTKHAAAPTFAIHPRDADHKPTFCVWELAPVWHEQQAWCRFLTSPRDEPAATRWLTDLYTGPA